MKFVMVSGSHPRHLHVVKKVAETGCLAGVVLMKRENMILDIPEGMDPSLTELYKHHFQLRCALIAEGALAAIFALVIRKLFAQDVYDTLFFCEIFHSF